MRSWYWRRFWPSAVRPPVVLTGWEDELSFCCYADVSRHNGSTQNEASVCETSCWKLTAMNKDGVLHIQQNHAFKHQNITQVHLLVYSQISFPSRVKTCSQLCISCQSRLKVEIKDRLIDDGSRCWFQPCCRSDEHFSLKHTEEK